MLGCYPYQEEEPFIIEECPHVFFVGNQPKFGTDAITGPRGQSVRLVAVPSFKETGQIVLVSSDTLEVELMKIALFDGNESG